MKLFNRTTKIAGTLAAALMISAPLAFAATPTFAATMHDNDRHDGDKDRGSYNRDHGVRHEKIAFHSHKLRHEGRWGYAHGKRVWIAAFNVR
jgi:hypothetical protein